MSHSSRTSHRLLAAAVLLLLAAPLPLSGAVRQVKPRTAAAPVVRGNSAIIALPLNPVVPPAQRSCTTKTASGLGYTMLRPASGTRPAESDVVLVNYIGYLAATGTVFDQGMQSAFPVNGVISGFSKGLQLIAKTGVARICIPAALGYGARKSGPIPANSDLVFQVELLDYKTAAEVEGMAKAQGADSPGDKEPASQP